MKTAIVMIAMLAFLVAPPPEEPDSDQVEKLACVIYQEAGGDEPENLVTLCKECHRKRHKELRDTKEEA